jgi:hypothetical protein
VAFPCGGGWPDRNAKAELLVLNGAFMVGLAAINRMTRHVNLVTSQRVNSPMKRSFVDYDTSPHGETLVERDPFE